MKKLLTTIIFLVISIGAMAQAKLKPTPTTGLLTNASYAYASVYAPIKSTSFSPTSVTIQLNLAKGTGTPAGYASIHGSVDGITYEKIGTDSVAISNTTTQLKFWKLTTHAYPYYRVRLIGSGTQSTAFNAWIHVN